MKQDLKKQVCLLRRNGFSFRELSERFNISKSTAYLWCKDEIIITTGKERLKQLCINGRKKAILKNKLKNTQTITRIKNCVYSFSNIKYSIYDYKLLLAMLYWGEGAKNGSCLDFTNSDPKLIAVYLKILRLSFDIKEEKFRCIIHLHSYHNKEEMLNFWSKLTNIAKSQISIYNKENSGKQKKLGYNGCISIRYHNYLLFNEVMVIIERFSVFLI